MIEGLGNRVGGCVRLLAACLVMLLPGVSAAQEVWITEDTPFVEFSVEGQTYLIERNQDQEARLDNSFSKTSRPCPPFCIHPMSAAPGVETVGELELIEFVETRVQSGEGLLVDSRLPDWYEAGTIPGSINLPFNLFNPDNNPFFTPIMTQLGGRALGGGRWDFSQARPLLLFCNGPWCDQSPRAIRNLIAAGYPAEKLKYYRGGMQSWLQLGLSTLIPAGS